MPRPLVPKSTAPPKPPGLREYKRQQTLNRIAQVGLDSFLAKGYDATTLDEIAAAAGISRRTFFYYFKGKDEILLAYLRVYADAIKAAVIANPPNGRPLDTALSALFNLVSGFDEANIIATARIMRQSEALRVRKHSGYLQFEQAIYEGLCELYPEREQAGLRLAAIVSISPLRVAVDTWLQEAKRPLIQCLQEAFDRFRGELFQ
jgi:AcrR family transcriptional regulator